MRILFIVMALIITGALVWYFKSSSPSTPDSGIQTSSSRTETTSTASGEDDKSQTDMTTTQSEDQKQADKKEPQFKERPTPPDGIVSDEDSDEADEEDYSEPVSKEDFKDFIQTALTELSEDEQTAMAIVREMAKIGKAQPGHDEEIINFYRECSSRPKIFDSVKQICQDALKERGITE